MVDQNYSISVIIPVYNCDRYLAQAIESVLAQTYQPMEIIVVDDGSTDNSGAVAKNFGSSVRYYFHDNSGLGATRNRGIELAQGNFLAFIDADDLWVENKLSHQIAAFETNPQLDIVFGLAQQLKIARSESKEIIDNYFEKYQGIKQYMEDNYKQ